VNARFPAPYDVCRDKLWQVLEPETRSLRLAMPILPGLDYLVRLANAAGI